MLFSFVNYFSHDDDGSRIGGWIKLLEGSNYKYHKALETS